MAQLIICLALRTSAKLIIRLALRTSTQLITCLVLRASAQLIICLALRLRNKCVTNNNNILKFREGHPYNQISKCQNVKKTLSRACEIPSG